MELNSKGRNLLKEDPNVWSCENCHDSNQFMIQPVVPVVKISIVEDKVEPVCEDIDCEETTIYDTPEPLPMEEIPLSIKIDPVDLVVHPVNPSASLLSNDSIYDFKLPLDFNIIDVPVASVASEVSSL